nr:hypothetical protein [Achromobacter insuavis]
MEQSSSTPPPKEAVQDIPIGNVADLPAEMVRLRELLARLTDEREQLKKRVMHLMVALAEARNGAVE